ncbi:TIGR03757 family integrating conjugative element protein [Pseudomonas sp. MYb185]|uniref:TIGR03757 family integrating conjugative element protein n=1 Tax=Pseudomonas sp. MYb185 TaxID=1848729 RepID=UPI000CFB8EF6|nr:TIGR03757 family integrating conjugative element protein [Pseudomonas sp. MYb185]PRB81526.1 TIGR03757 family integrating conjugative element protein [Pseudomonas sp. MYb185]
MRFITIGFTSLAMLACWSSSILASPEVFTASHIELSNLPENATVVELDALAGLDELLSLQLPGDPDMASAIALERMQSAKWLEMRERYEHAAMAVARAWMLGVEKIPAVVIDGHVVYGETDVATAVALIEEALIHAE